ncbi:MAG: carbon storage regulator [Fuerstiella sp.]
MLVLSRRLREQVLIPGLDIKITILSVGTNRVQLGIEAPQHIHITRPEAKRPGAAEFDDASLAEFIGEADSETASDSAGERTPGGSGSGVPVYRHMKLALYPSVEFQIA